MVKLICGHESNCKPEERKYISWRVVYWCAWCDELIKPTPYNYPGGISRPAVVGFLHSLD